VAADGGRRAGRPGNRRGPPGVVTHR
jgi:hypothetical protein